MDINILNEIKKIEFHQKLLLIIDLKNENDGLSFFEQLITHDVSEEVAKAIILAIDYMGYVRGLHNFSKERLIQLQSLLKSDLNRFTKFNLSSLSKLLSEVGAPTSMNIEYLLLAMKRQNLSTDTCIELLKLFPL